MDNSEDEWVVYDEWKRVFRCIDRVLIIPNDNEYDAWFGYDEWRGILAYIDNRVDTMYAWMVRDKCLLGGTGMFYHGDWERVYLPFIKAKLELM